MTRKPREKLQVVHLRCQWCFRYHYNTRNQGTIVIVHRMYPDAGKSEQVIRITQPTTVATRDNIYKQMGSQRTKANLYRAGYRKTKAALQEQQRINAAMATTLTTQNTMT